MHPTPETLTRHELIGLPIRVAAADNPDLVGIAGRVVGETMRTLRVEPPAADDGGRSGSRVTVKQVPKRGTTFEFALPADGDGATVRPTEGRIDEAAGGRRDDDRPGTTRRRKAPGSALELPWDTAGETGQSGGGEGVVYVTVDGARLLSRPARRTERAGDTIWH